MAIRKQNRTIWILAAVVFLVLLTFLIRDGKLQQFLEKPPEANGQAESPAANSEDQFGERVTEAIQKSEVPAQAKFLESLDRMVQCLQVQSSEVPEPAPLQIETLFQKVQTSFGPPTHQADKWMNWHLRARDGKEKRLRLEITETDEGKVGRELHYFNVDRDGQPTPVEIDPEKAANPTDDVISQMLKEGEVFYKERAAVAFFADNTRVEYIEKDGELSEIEVFRSDRQFRCANVKTPEICQCL